MAKSRALKVLQAPCPQPPYRHQDPHMFFPSSELIFTDSRSTSIVGEWPTWQPTTTWRQGTLLRWPFASAQWLPELVEKVWNQYPLGARPSPPKQSWGSVSSPNKASLTLFTFLHFFHYFWGKEKLANRPKEMPEAHQKHKTIMLGPICIFWLILYRIIYCVLSYLCQTLFRP